MFFVSQLCNNGAIYTFISDKCHAALLGVG